MRLWRRARRETRQQQPFTDAMVSGLIAQADGTASPNVSGLAALETAAGMFSRAFASATVLPVEAAAMLGASVRGLIGRQLIRYGETVLAIDVIRGAVTLTPAGSWDIAGGWAEASWRYRVDLFGPSGNVSRLLPSASVVHCRYAVDPANPWLGIGPLGWCPTTATLAAGLEVRLSEEVSASVAHVVPVPHDGSEESEDQLKGLRTDLRAAKGRTLLAETTAAGWGDGKMSAPQADWQPRRLGANPPPVLSALRMDATAGILGACGVPVSLITDADGTSQRESFRRFLTGGLEPLGELVAEELSRKLDLPVSFDFSQTYAHDLAGRAQAFGKLVAGGMDTTAAASLSGLVASDG